MKQSDFAALLEPYITGLSATQLVQLSTYVDLLLRWNAKTNLTAIRDPKQIVTRHFGESFSLANALFGSSAPREHDPPAGDLLLPDYPISGSPDVLDLGSGAGFPGIPLKIARPDITLTLVEAHHTKAVFLREVLRALELDADVKNVRAEQLAPGCASIVTLRAVEKFESILPTAAGLVRRPEPAIWDQAPTPVQATLSVPVKIDSRPPTPFRCLGLLISAAQIAPAREILPNWRFHPEIAIPNSDNRVFQMVEPNQ